MLHSAAPQYTVFVNGTRMTSRGCVNLEYPVNHVRRKRSLPRPTVRTNPLSGTSSLLKIASGSSTKKNVRCTSTSKETDM